MTSKYKAGRQSAHLNMSDEEFDRRLSAIADAFGADWLNAGTHPLQALWQRKDGFAVNQLCLLGDAIAGLGAINARWVEKHVEKIKGLDANERRGSMFELLGANLFRHEPQRVIPKQGGNPGYDFSLILPDGGAADLSLKGYGTSAHEANFRGEAAEAKEVFIRLLREKEASGGVLTAIANTYPSRAD